MNRLSFIKESGDFLICKSCGFTYIAFSSLSEKHCPKCESDKFESDKDYLDCEEKTVESVNSDNIFDEYPKISPGAIGYSKIRFFKDGLEALMKSNATDQEIHNEGILVVEGKKQTIKFEYFIEKE